MLYDKAIIWNKYETQINLSVQLVHKQSISKKEHSEDQRWDFRTTKGVEWMEIE